MRFRRLGELVLVLIACATLGWWSQRATAPSIGKLQELSYEDWPFHYSLTVKPDGSGEYRASFDCISGSPEPGQLGCQHLNGSLSNKELGQFLSGLRATHPEKFLTAQIPARHPGAGRSLDLKFDGKWASVADSRQSNLVFTALNKLHAGAIRKKLESKRASEERDLKKKSPR